MSLIGLFLIDVLIGCVVIWAVRALSDAFALPAPTGTVGVALVVVLWFVGQQFSGWHYLRL